MGGPAVPWRAGRVDAMTPDAVTPDGRLPEADAGRPEATAASLRQVFGRMGFDDREIVALSGAHALGRCHSENSGYVGPWQGAPTIVSNVYFKLLAKQTKAEYWTPDDRYSKLQYRDKSGTLSASRRSGVRFLCLLRTYSLRYAHFLAALSDAPLRPGAGAGRGVQKARLGVCQRPGGAAQGATARLLSLTRARARCPQTRRHAAVLLGLFEGFPEAGGAGHIQPGVGGLVL